MNTMQHKQLFIDLISTQAETIAGGDFPIPGGGPLRPSSRADASYGYASASFRRKSSGSFTTWLDIGDKAKDGYAVYAIFQGKTNDGRILSAPTRYTHKKGAGTSAFTSFDISFGNVDIRKIWVAICRDNPGKDLYVQGDWVYNP